MAKGDYSQNKFYYVPKERIANVLNLQSTFDPKGYLVCTYNRFAKINLYDYLVPQHVLRTPEMQAYAGKMGTRAEIKASYDDDFANTRSHLDRVAKQFEI